MALRDSKFFWAFGWIITVIALASFVLRVVLEVSSGRGGATYTGGTGLPWHYSSALVVLIAAGIVLALGGIAWTWRRIRRRRRSPDDET